MTLNHTKKIAMWYQKKTPHFTKKKKGPLGTKKKKPSITKNKPKPYPKIPDSLENPKPYQKKTLNLTKKTKPHQKKNPIPYQKKQPKLYKKTHSYQKHSPTRQMFGRPCHTLHPHIIEQSTQGTKTRKR